MKKNEIDSVIIGAGLTGLAMAYFLKKSGKSFIVLEKENRTGGVINSITEGEFLYETGPNTGVLSTREIVNIFDDPEIRSRLDTANSSAKNRYILKNGKWEPLPSGLISGLTTPLFTFSDKLRILLEPFRKPGNNPDETVGDLVIRRLGKSYLDYAVDPFISGIYAGDPLKLVTRHALPKLYALEQKYGSFIKGAIAKSMEPKNDSDKKVTREVFSVKGGLVRLVESLAEAAGAGNIITGCRDLHVLRQNGGFGLNFISHDGQSVNIPAKYVISTTGASSLQSLFPFIGEEDMKAITSLVYAGVVQVTAGFNRWHGKKLDAFGGLIPGVEKRDILGILFLSSIFENRAPAGGALLSVFMGGIRHSEILKWQDEEIVRTVSAEIESTLKHTGPPDLVRIHRYARAIPQYDNTSDRRLKAIASAEAEFPGLILAGNIRDGIGMADRVRQAKNIADQVK